MGIVTVDKNMGGGIYVLLGRQDRAQFLLFREYRERRDSQLGVTSVSGIQRRLVRVLATK